MQNYLIKSQRKKKRIVVKAAFVLLLLSAFALVFTYKGNDSTFADRITDSKFGSLFNGHGTGTLGDEDLECGKDAEKMNNAPYENSKIYASVSSTDVNKMLVETVILLNSDGSTQNIPLEEYVKGCVLGEMPLSFHREALMAQAVAARTFAVRSKTVSSKHKNADVCTDYRCCQSYVNPKSKTMNDEAERILADAVNSTKGIVAIYDGSPILAAYHSSSGEKTLSSKDVWGGDLPYLVSTPSPEGELEVSAIGNGHRVGMSQHGANILAAEGKGYADILKYYYSGISLCFVS